MPNSPQKPFYEKDGIVVYNGDNRDVLKTLPDCSVDSCVTDPPYGLSKEPDIVEVLTHWLAGDTYEHKSSGFMGKSWDSFVPGPEYWREVYRVLKPGAYVLCFASSRTFDLMAIALRMAGFEQHPFIAYLFGSGFPKATNLGKMIDKAAGAEREVVGTRKMRELPNDVPFGQVLITSHANAIAGRNTASQVDVDITAPATEAAKQWDGWYYGKQSLKPAMEPILMFQKPFEKGMTGAQNVLTHGTGAINVDACRVETSSVDAKAMERCNTPGSGRFGNGTIGEIYGGGKGTTPPNTKLDTTQGRWPANVIHDGSPEVLEAFEKFGESGGGFGKRCGRTGATVGDFGHGATMETVGFGDTGTAARFFYTAKADSSERRQSKHPTVKPLDLMRYLVRLVTPIGGVVLDPFTGSGSTIEAAREEHSKAIGIELSAEYCADAVARLRQNVFRFEGDSTHDLASNLRSPV